MEFKAQSIADFLGGTVEGNPNAVVSDVAKIEEGRPGTLAFLSNPKYNKYLYDNDIIASIKEWQDHPDEILSYLSRCIINRRLYKIKISKKPISEQKIALLKERICSHFHVCDEQMKYFLIADTITNSAYNKASSEKINVLFKNNKISDIADASDINLSVFSETVRKYFICYPKELDIK